MNTIIILSLLSIVLQPFPQTNAEVTDKRINEDVTTKNELLLTAAFYAKLFTERRKEHVFMVKQMLKSTYEKNFKLLKLGFAKIFEVLIANNDTLLTFDYQYGRDGFPQDVGLQESVILILENCCLAAENVLHFPEISYRIFGQKNVSNWKTTLNWCINFVHALPHLIDEPTFKMMELLQQEINEDLREKNYVNPYYRKKSEEPGEIRKQKKPYRKLEKGPQLAGGRYEL